MYVASGYNGYRKKDIWNKRFIKNFDSERGELNCINYMLRHPQTLLHDIEVVGIFAMAQFCFEISVVVVKEKVKITNECG